MANASKTEAVKLTLTMEQAYYLWHVLMNVGGSPEGPRGAMDEIYSALNKHAGDFEELDLPDLDINGSVILNNYEKGT